MAVCARVWTQSEWIQNKAVLWIVVKGDDVMSWFLVEMIPSRMIITVSFGTKIRHVGNWESACVNLTTFES